MVAKIEPHHGDRLKFFTGALQSLCLDCHERRKKSIERLGFDRTVGLDGYPIDRLHPVWSGALRPGGRRV